MARRRTTPTTPAVTPHSVPVARTESASDIDYDSLGGTPTLATAKPADGARTRLTMPDNLTGDLTRRVMAKLIAKKAGARLDQLEPALNAAAFKDWCRRLWKSKTRPEKPYVEVEKNGRSDITANFIVQERFTPSNINIPPLKEGQTPARALADALVDQGIEREDAERLVAQELDLVAEKACRNLKELLYGHYEGRVFVDATPEEVRLGKKLFELLKAEFTTEEQKLLIRTEIRAKVKKDFFGRVPNYCHSADQVEAVFRVITPVFYFGGEEFGLNDDEATKIERLKEEAGTFIGVP